MPPIVQEYRFDLAISSAAAAVVIWKWPGLAACCFRIAGFWMSLGEAVQYFGERRVENRTKAIEVAR